MNFLELVKSVGARTDVPVPETLSNTTSRQVLRLMEEVNEAYAIIWNSLYPKNEAAEAETTITIEAQTEYVPLPFPQVTQVATGKLIPLAIIPWGEYEQRTRDRSIDDLLNQGEPGICSIYQGRIYLYPRSDTSYTLTVRGNRTFTRLAVDTDEPLLAPQYHDVITMTARAIELQYQADPIAESVKMDALAYLKQVKINNRAHRQAPHQIQTMDRAMPYTMRRFWN